jgi:hypothetical protein
MSPTSYLTAPPRVNVNKRQKNRELERVMGIEPTLLAWEASALPLSYTRESDIDYTMI